MVKTIPLYIILLLCSSTLFAKGNSRGYDRFCGTQAATQMKVLSSEEHEKTLKEIEDLKDEYNKELANATVSTGVRSLNDKFIKDNDYSSALLLEMIIAMVKDPKAKNFKELCDRYYSKVSLCKLAPDKRSSVEATFNNFKEACNHTACDKNNDVASIKQDLIENAIKGHGNIELTSPIIAGLKPPESQSPVESEHRKDIRNKISEKQDTKFQDVENIKRYIAEKYLRTCRDAKAASEVHSNCGASGVPKVMKLEIADRTFEILGALSSQEGEASTFSKAEIKSFNDICDRNSSDNRFKNICEFVSEDFEKTQTVKEAKDWVEIRKNNYIVPDHTTREGYRIVPKETNTSLFLGAAAPAIANFSNFWMWDIQQQAQIDILGQQAILQRQYSFGYFSAYSNYGYFPATYMQPNMGVPSLSATTGFNFGP